MTGSGGDLKSDLGEEFLQIVGDLLVKAIQLGTALLLKPGIGWNRLEKARGEWRVNAFEQFEKHHADRVSFACQAVASGAFDFFNEAFGSDF
jgi:hypothetical protein